MHALGCEPLSFLGHCRKASPVAREGWGSILPQQLSSFSQC